MPKSRVLKCEVYKLTFIGGSTRRLHSAWFVMNQLPEKVKFLSEDVWIYLYLWHAPHGRGFWDGSLSNGHTYTENWFY